MTPEQIKATGSYNPDIFHVTVNGKKYWGYRSEQEIHRRFMATLKEVKMDSLIEKVNTGSFALLYVKKRIRQAFLDFEMEEDGFIADEFKISDFFDFLDAIEFIITLEKIFDVQINEGEHPFIEKLEGTVPDYLDMYATLIAEKLEQQK